METINLGDIIDEKSTTTKPPSQSIVGNNKRESNVTIKSPSLAVLMKNVCYNYGTSVKPLIALNNVKVNIPEGIM